MNYQKVYMNHIHSSSLLCQLAQMWRSQLLCDALICTGNVVTKAHRVVLLAACPMLQTMENASVGTELEVRLAADIKQEAVNTFLQYLYEGFMLLTEENVKHVEKVARLLQVDSVIKCCSDFFKCLETSTGKMHNANYKFDKYDLLEFRHVRATGLQKTYHDRLMKRMSESTRPTSPLGGKRQRLHHPTSPLSDFTTQKFSDVQTSNLNFAGSVRSGASSQSSNSNSPAVVEIVEDSLELIQREKSVPGQPEAPRLSQQKTSISIASHVSTTKDTRIVSIADDSGGGNTHTSDSSISKLSVSPKMPFHDSHPSQKIQHPSSTAMVSRISSFNNFSSQPPPPPLQQAPVSQGVQPRPPEQLTVQPRLSQISSEGLKPSFLTSTPQRTFPHNQPSSSKPSFATGSASQLGFQSQSSSFQIQPSSHQKQQQETSQIGSVEVINRKEGESSRSQEGHDPGPSESSQETDLSIVKIEKIDEDTGGLMLHVDSGQSEGHGFGHFSTCDDNDNDESELTGDWGQEDMSNEGIMLQGDQSMGGAMFMGPSSGFNLGDYVNRQRKHKAYNEVDLLAAVRAVQQGGMSANKAAQIYGIPRRTVSYRVKRARELLINSLSQVESDKLEKKMGKVLGPNQYKHILPKTDEDQEYLLIDDDLDQMKRDSSPSSKMSATEVPLYLSVNQYYNNADDTVTSPDIP